MARVPPLDDAQRLSTPERVRRFFTRPEAERIADLELRLDHEDTRSEEVSKILPSAMRHTHEQGKLAPVIKEPLTEILPVAVREKPESFADALFPVMGPAIRKAVAEAMKTLSQQLNDAIDHSVSPRGLRWRVEARRAGVPFGEYVMQQTRGFVVEQAFLIQEDSGLLIAHVQKDFGPLRDKAAISAMFAALQSFVQESFQSDDPANLDTAEFGGLTFWALHGPNCVLVCAIEGLPPRQLRTELKSVLEDIEGQHGTLLRDFDGDQHAAQELVSTLRGALKSYRPDGVDQTDRNRFSPLRIIAALLLIALLGLSALFIQEARFEARIAAALNAEAGIRIDDVELDGNRLRVTGSRDPLAADPLPIVAEHRGSKTFDVELALTPVLSLEPEIVGRRALRALNLPPGVTLERSAGSWHLAGTADAAWLDEARRTIAVLPGMERVEIDVSVPPPAADGDTP